MNGSVHAQEAQTTQAAPDTAFSLKGLDGKFYDTTAMKGEVLVASFGATWCVPCVWELKAIEELVEEFEGKPVRFLWISIETKKRTSDSLLRNFAKTYRLTIPVLRDENGTVFGKFSDTRRIPTIVYFDKEGRFQLPTQRGMSSDPIEYKDKVRKRVEALLAAASEQKTEGAK